ncbi:MAG TPA: glycosyltransferase family A protein, partial [Stellaceae bacterium]|nr:glycosyltransferase family A protein [Stellaceae bacterium]
LAAGDERINLSHGPNAGPAAARNVCLARARGEYIAFIDHDDIWSAGRIQRHLDLLRRDDAAAGVLGETFIFDTVDAAGNPTVSPASRRVLTGLLQAGLFRRAALAQIGPLDASLAAADDLDLLLRFVEAGFRLHVDNEIAVYYRLHAGQWTADLEKASLQTVRALGKSLARRRQKADGTRLAWRSNDDWFR